MIRWRLCWKCVNVRGKETTWVIFWMKISLGSSPVGSDTTNSSPKSQNTRTQMPWAPPQMNWRRTKCNNVWLVVRWKVYINHFGVLYGQRCWRLTLMGGCCEWQNLLTLFCRLKLDSVKITHCKRKHNSQNIVHSVQQTMVKFTGF